MNNYYNIQPVSIGVGLATAVAVGIQFVASYTPFEETMPFGYYFISPNGEVIFSGLDTLDQEVLSHWGDNDNYIIEAMAAKVGVTVIW